MKKVLSFLLIATMAVGLVSCGSLEDEAQMQLRETLNEFAKNPDTFKLNEFILLLEFLNLDASTKLKLIA